MKKLYIFIALLTFSTDSNAVSRFDPILKEIVKFQEFEAETKKYMDESFYQNSEMLDSMTLSQRNDFEEKKETSINNLETYIDDLYKNVLDIKKNKKTGNDFLEYLLEKHLNQIHERKCLLEQKISLFPIIPPTDDQLFKTWSLICKKPIYLKFNELIIKTNIKTYQLNIFLIKKIFQILTIDELSKKTIQLLRSAPMLWPILQNKTFNLGHLDESGGYIKVKIFMEHFKCSIEKALSFITFGPSCPAWEKKKKLYNVYWYESHFIPKKRFIESKNLGADGSGIIYTLTDYEAGECDDLPYPDFLKVQPERPFIESERFFDTFNFDTFNDEINEFEETPVLSTEANLSSENIINIIDINNIINSSESTPSESVSNDTIENNITSDSDNDYLLPSGIRKFHNLMPEAPYPPISLKRKDQKFVDKIFNSKTSHTISYGEFKKFWNKMNGQIIEDTGSSHKHLIGPKGDSLYGVAAHNDAHTYGKKTIKYFRAALYYIGCRPS